MFDAHSSMPRTILHAAMQTIWNLVWMQPERISQWRIVCYDIFLLEGNFCLLMSWWLFAQCLWNNRYRKLGEKENTSSWVGLQYLEERFNRDYSHPLPGIPHDTWEEEALQKVKWRALLRKATSAVEEQRQLEYQCAHDRRHSAATLGIFQCNSCRRYCRSRAGLTAHVRACLR